MNTCVDAKESNDDPNRFEGSPAKGQLDEADDKAAKSESSNIDLEGSMDSKGEPRDMAGADAKGSPVGDDDAKGDKAVAADDK